MTGCSTQKRFSGISIISLLTLAMLLMNTGKLRAKSPNEKQADDIYISIHL